MAIAGCGGGDGDKPKPATASGASAPVAKEPLAAAAKRLQAALPRGDCDELIGVMIHSIQRGQTKPGAPPTPSECQQMRREAARELRGYRVTKVKELGVAGFTEGTGTRPRPGEAVGVVWLLDSDGSWKAVFDAIFRRQIGEAPQLTAEADRNARGFVTALRAADCPLIWRGLHVFSRFVRGNGGRREPFCRATAKLYRDPRSAFAQIRADPSAAPKLLGRTRDFSFYSLELKNGRYMALVVAGAVGGIASRELRQHVNPSVLEFLSVRQPG
jgi:hypothetical protein